MKDLISELTQLKSALTLLFVSLFFAALSQSIVLFIFPFLNIIIYDNLIITLDKRLLFEFLLVMAVLLFSMAAFSLVLDISASLLRTKVSTLMRSDLLDRLLKYKYSFYIENETGRLVQKLIPDMDVVADASAKLFLSIAYFFQLIFLFVIVAMIDSQILIIYLGMLVIYWLWLIVWRPHVVQSSSKIGAEYGSFYSCLYEVFPGIKEIKYLGLNEYVKGRVLKNLLNIRRYQLRNSIFNSFLYMSNSIIPWVGYCAILVVGLFKIGEGKFTIGLFVAIFSFMWRIFTPVDKIMEGYLASQEAKIAIQRINQVREDYFENNGKVHLKGFTDSIEYRNLYFRYNDEREILKGVNLRILKGQNVAFVGHSGSGKTTLVHLFIKLFDGYKGKILLDGRELSEFELTSLRKFVSIVSQDVYLFNDTIRRNIDFTETIPDEKILEYCRYSHLWDLIIKLPEGLDTIIGERGVKLSGGEKQRLALARTFAKNSEIIIFDEATSALDPKLEKEIKDSILLLNKNRTTITITHRPSTVVDLDHIFVLKDGEIVEEGSHGELMSHKGHYYELFYH